jgi:methionyl-tRNA formyltransferase
VYHSKASGKSQRVTIAGAQVVEDSNPSTLACGTLDESLNIICSENALKITQIKPAGASLMDFQAFVNGRHTRPGDMFFKIGEEPGPRGANQDAL